MGLYSFKKKIEIWKTLYCANTGSDEQVWCIFSHMYMLAYDCQICGSLFGINKGKAQETRKKGPRDWKQEETPGKEEKAVGQSERESKDKWAGAWGGSFKMKAHLKAK